MASRKIFKKKTVIPKFLKTKFNEIDFQQEEPYWNFILRLPGPEIHPSNRAPEKNDCLKKMHWSPRMAEKWVWESVELPRGGLWAIYFFYEKSNFLFSILIDSPGIPGDPGDPPGPGDP